jgi:hypothetical protein
VRIDERRKAFEKNIFSEASIMGALRYIYGPQNFHEARTVLSEIKMDKNYQHYATPQPAIDYCMRYDTALQWICDIGLSEGAIIKQFIKGVQPAHLAGELELREFKEFKLLKNFFTHQYFDNHKAFKIYKSTGALCSDDGTSKEGAGAAVAAAGTNKFSAPAAAAAATRKWEQVPTASLKASPAKDSKGPGTPLSEITCWHCEEKGHRASSCPKKAAASPGTKAPATPTAKRPCPSRRPKDEMGVSCAVICR